MSVAVGATLRPARGTARMAGALALGLVAATALIAVFVRATCAPEARALLGFGFGGVAPNLRSMLDILQNNLGMLAAIGALASVVQLARGNRAILRAADAVLCVAVAINVLLVGVGVGAYGGRMVAGLLPHGPVELAGYCLAVAGYLEVRRHAIPAARAWRLGAACVATLIVAAALEVFVAL